MSTTLKSKFGGFLAITDYKDPVILDEINQNGWMLWPPIRYSYNSINRDYPRVKGPDGNCLGFPAPPPWATSAALCDATPDQLARFQALGNRNWLGTDDQGRDVVARIIYGFRISILFGLILTVFSAAIGVAAGAAQGYFGGRVDLVFQRVLEIWSSIPSLYVLIIISSVLVARISGRCWAFCCSSSGSIWWVWCAPNSFRGRNFEYITAARALGLSNFKIMSPSTCCRTRWLRR